MKKIVMLILMLSIGMVNVDAAASYSVTKNEYGISKACDYPIISNEKTCNSSTTYRVGNGETFYINYNGKTLSGYCIDPGLAGPKNVVEVSTDEISEHLEALKYICEKTEGNEVLRGAMMKAYSVRNGIGKVGSSDKKGTIDAYNKLGTVTKFNEKYDPSGNALNILKEAEAKKGKNGAAVVNPTFSKEGEFLVLKTPVAGKLEIAGSESYEILINGTTQTSPFTVTTPGTYKIKMTNPTCTGDATITANATFKYEKDDLPGTSSSSYNVRYFKDKVNASQRLVTCEKLAENENPNCVGNDCKIDDNLSAKCSGETCEEIEFKSGAGICDENGTTVVTVLEKPNDLAYANSTCITKLPNATKAILGDDNNDYCKIYCSENYELVLPGPDAKTGDDKNVFINAGSYFTIDDSEMKDKTTFTCYGKINYTEYENDVNTARTNVINKYNELSKLKAYKKALEEAVQLEGKCQIGGSYKELYLTSTGEIKSKTTDLPNTEGITTCPPNKVPESDIKTLESELSSAITKAENDIKKFKEDWNQCVGWNFDELNKLLNQDDCSTNLEFNYQFDECGVTIDKGTPNVVSTDKKTSSTSSKKLYTSVCDINGDLAKCNKTAENVEAYTYINQQEVVQIDYKFNNEFTVNFETGELSCDAKTGDKYSDVIKGFPVSLEATQAKYAYEYKYTNIGHDFDAMNAGTCEMGRFDSVIKDKNSHSCYYDVNNCGDCDVVCEDPNGGDDCDFDFCDGECQVACVGGGCILDFNAGFLATYRTMSLNNPFPNAVSMISSEPASLLAVASTKDYVANYDTNWTTEKGIAATTNITTAGEGIYNAEPQYSITLTPTVISEIRKYNSEQEDGYLNKTLSCIDGANKNYGQCISSFIHEDGEKWEFETNDVIDQNNQMTLDIGGVAVPFVTYNGTTKPFIGPAWK